MTVDVSRWMVQIKGDPNSESWEISVIREDYALGQQSWGWFNERKLLVSHNGGPCRWPLAPGLGPVMVEIATRLCDHLNSGQHTPPDLAKDLVLGGQ